MRNVKSTASGVSAGRHRTKAAAGTSFSSLMMAATILPATFAGDPPVGRRGDCRRSASMRGRFKCASVGCRSAGSVAGAPDLDPALGGGAAARRRVAGRRRIRCPGDQAARSRLFRRGCAHAVRVAEGTAHWLSESRPRRPCAADIGDGAQQGRSSPPAPHTAGNSPLPMAVAPDQEEGREGHR